MGVNIKNFIREEMEKEYFQFWIVKKNRKFLQNGLELLLDKNADKKALKEFG